MAGQPEGGVAATEGASGKAAAASRKAEQSITEKVLEFAKSSVSVSQLEEINAVRNKRAILRSKGFDIFTDIVKNTYHPFALTLVTKMIRQALQGLKMDSLPSSAGSGAALLGAGAADERRLLAGCGLGARHAWSVRRKTEQKFPPFRQLYFGCQLLT